MSKSLHMIKIVHDPENGLSINDKPLQPLVDVIHQYATENEINMHEMMVGLLDTICVQAAGADYEDALDNETLSFIANMLGLCYNNAMKGFAEGAINVHDVPPPSPYGAN